MSVQQSAAPNHRRGVFIGIALLLVALVAGAVTAVNLFPTKANERPAAGTVGTGTMGLERQNIANGLAVTVLDWTSLEAWRAQERDPQVDESPAQQQLVSQTYARPEEHLPRFESAAAQQQLASQTYARPEEHMPR
jgi:hypothetical protein